MKTSEQLRKELYQHIYEMQEKQQKLDVDHIQKLFRREKLRKLLHED